MRKEILAFLKTYRKTIIPLSQLENLFPGSITYSQFVETVQLLEKEGLLKPVLARGTNGKSPPLYHAYRIDKQRLKIDLVKEIQHYSLLFHPAIKLSAYFSLSEEDWQRDLPPLKKVNAYLQDHGLPQKEATNPERSLELFADEKWIDEKGGQALLERVQLWDQLKIADSPDPLMLAVNPVAMNKTDHCHLIVENKAIFYALLKLLTGSPWTSLIFGSGWKILANLTMAVPQLGLVEKNHLFYYFGDLDPEGIAIWYGLREKYSVELALPFYQALLTKPCFEGKANQLPNPVAIKAFSSQFHPRDGDLIAELLGTGRYHPQEALDPDDLAIIWRDEKWIG